ncbi:CPBP family intramembrane glutamic endopeptidase [Saccharomonospora saliphila]|uniref:CPBP family intramembrane glutamic endopeptidase n=1 Tax=Saccharomonospora saliphila TaxID=369829 RepID=UPI000376AB53|nr:CPBP family intramembrane glutamic endopeptidase [Saccharomonospora saliphila]
MEREDGAASARDGLVLGAHWGFLTFFASYGAYYAVTLVLSGLALNGGADPLTLPRLGPLVLLAFLPNLLLGLGPVLGSLRWGRGSRVDFGLVPTMRDVRIGVACGGFSLLAAYLLNLLLFGVYGPERMPDPVTDAFGGLGSNVGWLLLAALVLVAGAPLTEELLFRGALWNALGHYRVPPWVVLVVTALVFAQVHGEPTRTLALVGQGVAIGAARMITGRVGSSVVAHAVNNLPPALLLFGGS